MGLRDRESGMNACLAFDVLNHQEPWLALALVVRENEL